MAADTHSTGNIDMQLGELEGIIDALILLQEEGDDSQRVRNSSIALLYVAGDKIRSALGSTARLYRPELAPH